MIIRNNSASFPQARLRRLRGHERLRELLRETTLSISDLVFPLFICHGQNIKRPINSMPGQFQLSLDQLPAEIREIQQLQIPAVILFGIPEKKDAIGSDSYAEQGIMSRAIRTIKDIAPDLLVISDVCFCEYTDHGHCGVMRKQRGEMILDNDSTLELLGVQAVNHANAGADVVAPSGMIDGMVQAIRSALDKAEFSNLPILSYAAKYCSALYGPFREAAESAPQFGDRKSYQMDPANSDEAMREVMLDIEEGADIVMVKPALAYLDVIYRVKQTFPEVPLAAYQVSGEYAMLKAAAQNGWLDEQRTALEMLTAIKRAGSNFIISYFAKEVARWLS